MGRVLVHYTTSFCKGGQGRILRKAAFGRLFCVRIVIELPERAAFFVLVSDNITMNYVQQKRGNDSNYRYI